MRSLEQIPSALRTSFMRDLTMKLTFKIAHERAKEKLYGKVPEKFHRPIDNTSKIEINE